VFRLYDDRDQLVVSDQVMYPRWEPSEAMVAAANREMLVLVVYDGDTGMRWSDEDFQQAGFQSGQIL
jgi:hypothetical protein